MASSSHPLEKRYTDDDIDDVPDIETFPFSAAEKLSEPLPVKSCNPVKLPADDAFGIYLEGLLTENECGGLIGMGPSLGMVPAASRSTYRNCDRSIFKTKY